MPIILSEEQRQYRKAVALAWEDYAKARMLAWGTFYSVWAAARNDPDVDLATLKEALTSVIEANDKAWSGAEDDYDKATADVGRVSHKALAAALEVYIKTMAAAKEAYRKSLTTDKKVEEKRSLR